MSVDSLGYVYDSKNNPYKVVDEKSVGALGQDDFINLLMAQMKNQDPLNPLDNNEFINQMTNFNMLTQLTEINEKLGEKNAAGGLIDILQEVRNSQESQLSESASFGGLLRQDMQDIGLTLKDISSMLHSYEMAQISDDGSVSIVEPTAEVVE